MSSDRKWCLEMFRALSPQIIVSSTPRRCHGPTRLRLGCRFGNGMTLGPDQFQMNDACGETRLVMHRKLRLRMLFLVPLRSTFSYLRPRTSPHGRHGVKSSSRTCMPQLSTRPAEMRHDSASLPKVPAAPSRVPRLPATVQMGERSRESREDAWLDIRRDSCS